MKMSRLIHKKMASEMYNNNNENVQIAYGI